MRSGERGGGGLTKKGRLTINNTGGHPSSGAGGGELNRKSNRLRHTIRINKYSLAPAARREASGRPAPAGPIFHLKK